MKDPITIDQATRGMKWTTAQIEAEKQYRIQERLGMMCGADKPTDKQTERARQEASHWDFVRECKQGGIDLNAI